MTETTTPDTAAPPFALNFDAECCGFCAAFNVGTDRRSKVGQCRRNPPTTLVVGMKQGALGPEPAFDSYFPLVLTDWWCLEFRRRVVKTGGVAMSVDTMTQGPEQ